MKLFLVDNNKVYSYADLLKDINQKNYYSCLYKTNDLYKYFLNFLVGLLSDQPLTLIDSDINDNEINSLGINEEINIKENTRKPYFETIEKVIEKIEKSTSEISIFTSGTTGQPKNVKHTVTTLTRSVRIDEKYAKQVWAFAYNPTHMAGLQVFFQVFMNTSTMINVFNQTRQSVYDLIEKYAIDHISATPTFYRLLLPVEKAYPTVVRVTFGGEKSDKKLYDSILKIFPKAKINNIYASTEAGSLFCAKGEYFVIPAAIKDKVKIVDNEVLLHQSLLGKSDSLLLNNGYYHTGDLIEWHNEEDGLFRFVNRKNELINVGGYKVNPQEVRDVILTIEGIQDAVVYAKANSVLGNILCADIKTFNNENNLSEIQIRNILSTQLQEFKVPRRIKFVDELSLTRTGKIQTK